MSPKLKTLPKKVSILGRPVTVVREDMKDGEYGEYIQHKYLIKVSKSSNIDEAMNTLFHECVHAALHISGLSQMIPQAADDNSPDLEEALVVMLESAFSHVIDINKLKLDT